MVEQQLSLLESEEGDLVALMRELCECIDRFNEQWPKYVKQVRAYQIPFYEDGLVPEFVKATPVEGDAAIALCKQAFRGFSRPREQHPGTVYRLPGIIVLKKWLLDEIDEINGLKHELRDAIKERCPNERTRSVFCGQVFPGRVMLQVYREIRSTRSPVKAIRFSWSPGANVATTRLTKGEVLELLHNRLALGIDVGNHKTALNMAIEKVHALSKSTTIIKERPRAPYPVATIVHSAGRNGIRKMVPLSLPLFVGPGIGGEDNDIGTLGAHDTKVRRQVRSDKIESKLLFNPLYLRYR